MLASSGKGEDEESDLFLKIFGWMNYICRKQTAECWQLRWFSLNFDWMIIYFEQVQVQVKTIK